MMQPNTTQYHAFLLRVWREQDQWRIVLESAETGQKVIVEDLAQLAPLLKTQMESSK